MNHPAYILTVYLVLNSLVALGTSQSDSTTSSVEILGLGSTGSRTPFWNQTNQWGIVPTENAVSIRGSRQHFWNLTTKNGSKTNWQAEAGGELVGNISKNSQLILPQAYAAISYKNWEFSAGRRKQWVGLADSTLGTGSYIWSGNAIPIPRIQISLKEYSPVPYTRNWLAIKGFYADGWFDTNRPVTSQLKLHQKQLYGRIRKPGSWLTIYGGFNHQVQWGGRSPYLTIDGQMPKGFKDYLYMITGTNPRGSLDTTLVSDFDNSNRVGNHLGTIDMALEIQGNNSTWFFYRQNIYEDGSLYFLTNIADGLNGLRIRRKNAVGRVFSISELTFEGLYTKSQGGPSFILKDDKKRGKDNYFNNSQVRDGWSYNGRTIGTPFIPPTSETIWKYPNYADFFTSNNRVWVLHTGMRGSFLNRYEWTTKLSYSSNIGVYDQPFPKTVYQFSGLLAVQTKVNWLGGTVLKGSIATDIGELYPNSTGIMLSLRKDWGFSGKNQEKGASTSID